MTEKSKEMVLILKSLLKVKSAHIILALEGLALEYPNMAVLTNPHLANQSSLAPSRPLTFIRYPGHRGLYSNKLSPLLENDLFTIAFLK